jgi:dihydropteroate synthase
MLKQLETFSILNFPILVGISRKSMIQDVLNVSVAETLTGTTTLNMLALYRGATILRVHDVKQCAETIMMFNSIN